MKQLLKKTWLLPLLAFTLSSLQCRKNRTKTPLTELEKLPPITQTGANTFGCLINGVAWKPNGRKPQNGGPNIVPYIDPTFQGGRFYISGKGYNENYRSVGVGSATCTSAGFYSFDSNSTLFQYMSDGFLPEIDYTTPNGGIFRKGFLNITRYDLTTGIFSGTFEAIVFKMDGSYGDTLKITNGRFDVKL